MTEPEFPGSNPTWMNTTATKQGSDYVINGHMIGGFAFVAWPAEYGESGIMTFIVNQQGRVFQKDLGKATDKTASKMTTYDPDSSWKLSPD